MGPQDYQDALDALNSPDAPAPVKAAAKRLVERYSSAMAKDQLKGRTEASLAESSSLGPTGIDAMAAGGLTPPPPGQEEIESTIAAGHPELSSEQGRQISRALKLQAPPTASRFADTGGYQAPPDLPNEWHPPPPPAGTGFDAVWGKLSAAKRAIQAEHFIEPSIDQFHREMAPVFGPASLKLGPQSDEYRVYADAKYREALALAQQQGHGIIREQYAHPGSLTHLAGQAGGALNSALIGADEAITGGIGGTAAYRFDPFGLEGENAPASWREAKEKKAVEAAYSPAAHDVGFALGVLSPDAVGNMAVEGALRGASRIPGVANKLAEGGKLATLGAGAGAGYIGAGATTLAGEAPDVVLGDESAGEALRKANTSGLYGALPGALGATLGMLARNEGNAIRQTTPYGEAEAGGASMGILGVKPGAANKGLEARARAGGFGSADKPDVEAMLASDLREPFTKRIHAREGEIKAQAAPLREFEEAFSHEAIPLPHTIRAIMDAKRKLVLSDGTVSDPAAMKQLDALLEKVAAVRPQAPFPAAADPERVAQLDRAIELHGVDVMAPENFQRDVEQLSTPTRPITPEASRVAAETPRATGDTDVDLFGPFSGGMPTMQEGIAAGGAGERIRTLHEARGDNPNVFDMTPREAAERGLPVGTDELGRPNFARVSPAGRNPGDVRQLSAALEREHKSGSVSEQPFPGFDAIKRAFHQDRDAFRGETGAIKQSQTFQLDNGETVRGYSAANAEEAKAIAEFDNLKELLGLKKQPNADESAMLQAFEGKARGFGKGGRSPAVDEAFRQTAAESSSTGTLEQMTRYRKMLELAQRTKGFDALRFWSHPEAARLRLDPVLQALIPYLENAGSLGALPGEMERSRELPAMADQATLDEIRRVLGP